MNNTYPTLLKKILEERNISYSVLSKMTDISKSTISSYANGTRSPVYKNVCIIMQALNIPSHLFYILFDPI